MAGLGSTPSFVGAGRSLTHWGFDAGVFPLVGTAKRDHLLEASATSSSTT